MPFIPAQRPFQLDYLTTRRRLRQREHSKATQLHDNHIGEKEKRRKKQREHKKQNSSSRNTNNSTSNTYVVVTLLREQARYNEYLVRVPVAAAADAAPVVPASAATFDAALESAWCRAMA